MSLVCKIRSKGLLNAMGFGAEWSMRVSSWWTFIQVIKIRGFFCLICINNHVYGDAIWSRISALKFLSMLCLSHSSCNLCLAADLPDQKYPITCSCELLWGFQMAKNRNFNPAFSKQFVNQTHQSTRSGRECSLRFWGCCGSLDLWRALSSHVLWFYFNTSHIPSSLLLKSEAANTDTQESTC